MLHGSAACCYENSSGQGAPSPGAARHPLPLNALNGGARALNQNLPLPSPAAAGEGQGVRGGVHFHPQVVRRRHMTSVRKGLAFPSAG